MKKRVVRFFIMFFLFGLVLAIIQIAHFGSLTGFISYDNPDEKSVSAVENSFAVMKIVIGSMLTIAILLLLVSKVRHRPKKVLVHQLR